MEVFGLLIVLVLYRFYKIWKNYQEEQEQIQINDVNNNLYDQAVEQMKEEREQEIMENKGTRDLFLETLTKIGCQYELGGEEDNNRIYFGYQGERFFVDATNEGWYIHIYDTHWGHVELYDIDEFTRLKKAIIHLT